MIVAGDGPDARALRIRVRPSSCVSLHDTHTDATPRRADLKLYKEVVGHMNGAKYSSLYL